MSVDLQSKQQNKRVEDNAEQRDTSGLRDAVSRPAEQVSRHTPCRASIFLGVPQPERYPIEFGSHEVPADGE